MTLVGLALGAGLGAAYGLVIAPSVFLLTGVLGSEGAGTNAQVAGGAYFLMIFSTPFGAVLGALAGLTLGIVEGVLLCVVTLFRYSDSRARFHEYKPTSRRARAGIRGLRADNRARYATCRGVGRVVRCVGTCSRVVHSGFVLTLVVSNGKAALFTLASGLVGGCGIDDALHALLMAIVRDYRPSADVRS